MSARLLPLPEILPATAEHASPDLLADYRDGRDAWREVSASFYDDMLGAVPPIYSDGAWMCGEESDHTPEGIAVFAAFACVDGRYFARMSTASTLPVFAHQLRNAICEGR